MFLVSEIQQQGTVEKNVPHILANQAMVRADMPMRNHATGYQLI
jgi:hypothetical protein